jgi:hypothetical protein
MRHASTLFLALALLFSSACQKGRATFASENVDQDMVSLSAQAVERARSSYGVTLDYSPDSVKQVETLLATKYELQKTHPMTEQEIADAAHLWGAYVGEVIKRIHPAHWVRDSQVAGKDALPIVYEDNSGESYPCAWVYHRLKNGEEDNVWIKFHYYTQAGGLEKYFQPKTESASPGKNKNAPKS